MVKVPGDEARRSAPSAGTGAATLAALTFLPILPWLAQLGLYSDDYGIVVWFESLRDQAWPELIGTIIEGYATRPAQGLASALLYFAFGLDPLPYVIVEAGLVAASAVLLWRLFVKCGVQPTIAFGASAIFCLLPQLSTVRIWFATLCVAAAMAFFLIGMLCLLRWLDNRRARWSIAALVAWAMSLAFYELFAPFMGLGLTYAVWRSSADKRAANLLRAAPPLLPHLAMIVAALIAKSVVTDREEGWHPKWIIYQALKLDYESETEFGFNLLAFLQTQFFETFAFPLRSLVSHGSLAVLACAAAAGLLAAVAMRRCDWQVRSRTARQALWIGLAASIAGYGIFLLVGATSFTVSGIGNRTAVASAMGVALAMSAAALLVTGLAPARARRGLGLALFALLATLMTMGSARITGHWARAYGAQQAVLANVRGDLASIPAGAIVLIDGICPYDGPAIVFETDWDVAGALSLAFDRPISGNIVTHGTRFDRSGVKSRIYAFDYFYPYGPHTYAYDARTRSATRLADWSEARSYAAAREPLRCPPGYPAHGVPI